jgi:ADP-ribose pyrophosphatase YjhB (NUDIX family)
MPDMGVTVVVMHNTQVLLTKRADFAVWCLPGGAVDHNETLEQAALREVQEETGLRITLIGLIGICSRPFWTSQGTHSVVFAAQPHSHRFIPQPNEVTAIDYFPHDQLPAPILWEHPTYIQAAFRQNWGQLWASEVRPPADLLDRAALYTWRDQLGVSHEEAYRQLLQRVGPCELSTSLDPSEGKEL